MGRSYYLFQQQSEPTTKLVSGTDVVNQILDYLMEDPIQMVFLIGSFSAFSIFFKNSLASSGSEA